MDTFREQIVKQKMDLTRMAIVVAGVFGALALCAAVFYFIPILLLPVAAGCAYGLYWLVTSQSWEVEYAVTNGDIDIDRIVARRTRKTIVRVRGEKIEQLLPIAKRDPKKKYDRVVMAARTPSTATWFFTYHGKSGSTIVLFEPDQQLLKALHDGTSRLVQIETDRAMREY